MWVSVFSRKLKNLVDVGEGIDQKISQQFSGKAEINRHSFPIKTGSQRRDIDTGGITYLKAARPEQVDGCIRITPT